VICARWRLVPASLLTVIVEDHVELVDPDHADPIC
jgi:hypothetical protein